MKILTFKNFTDKPFAYKWNSDEYTFQPGQEMAMEDWKAEHFAKHLIDIVLNERGLMTNDQSQIALLKKECLIDPEIVQSPSNIIDKNVKAERKTKKIKVQDEEFPDLKK